MTPRLLVFCDAPGLIRAGVRHPRFATHALDAFDADQLRELQREPSIVLAVGHALDDGELLEDFLLLTTDNPPESDSQSAEAVEGKAASAAPVAKRGRAAKGHA